VGLLGGAPLCRSLGFAELRKKGERFLPAENASFIWVHRDGHTRWWDEQPREAVQVAGTVVPTS